MCFVLAAMIMPSWRIVSKPSTAAILCHALQGKELGLEPDRLPTEHQLLDAGRSDVLYVCLRCGVCVPMHVCTNDVVFVCLCAQVVYVCVYPTNVLHVCVCIKFVSVYK
jgi:hypothetical protein